MSTKDIHQLSSTDAQMYFVETGATPNHITPVMIFDQSTVPGGKLRLKQIVDKVEEALDRAPIFRKRMVKSPLNLDNPYWVDDPHFNINFHVRHMALPQPGDWRQMCIQVARLLSRSIDTNRPLWEMYVIEGLDNVEDLPKGAFAIVFKIHHAMVDGMGFVNLLSTMLDDKPVPPPKHAPKREKWVPEPGPNFLEMTGYSWLHSVKRPRQFYSRAAKIGSGALKQWLNSDDEDDGTRKRGKVPKSILNGAISPSRVFEATSFSLAETKTMRSIVPGATVNDVALAILGGALRRYLAAKDALPEASLVAAVPISVRSEKTKETAGGNEVYGATVELFTDIESPVERLAQIAAAMNEIKNAPNAMGMRAITELTNELPGSFAGLLGRGLEAVGNATGRPMMANVTVTNVPGMVIPMYMLGAKLVNSVGGGPLINNMGVIHLISSYCDKMSISVVGCQNLLPDPEFYLQCIKESYAEYSKLAAKTPAKKKSKS